MKLAELMPNIFEMIPHDYGKIKSPLYEDIINRLLKDAKVSPVPKLTQISGGPAAGKTTFYKNFKTDEDGVFISFDAIMSEIPQYQDDLRKEGPVNTFKKWEIPARIVGYELLRRALEVKTDIILEHSGVNIAHIQLFENAKQMGYETQVDFMMCDADVACKRAGIREKEIKRHTPEEIIKTRYGLVPEYIDRYKSRVDRLNVYKSTTGGFVLSSKFINGQEEKSQ